MTTASTARRGNTPSAASVGIKRPPRGPRTIQEIPELSLGPTDSRLFVWLLAIFGLPALFAFLRMTGWGTFAALVLAGVTAFRLAHVRGPAEIARGFLFERGADLSLVLILPILFQWMYGWVEQVYLLGWLAHVLYLVATAAVVLNFGGQLGRALAPITPQVIPEVLEIDVSMEALAEQLHFMNNRIQTFNVLATFTIDDPRLPSAWAKQDVAEIERLLNAAGEKCRRNWEAATAEFNRSIQAVDFARGKLRYLLATSEEMLASFKFDYSAILVSPSKTAVGYVPVVQRQPDFSQRGNYSSIVGRTAFEVSRGSMPWQVGAIVAAGVVVMHFVNKSRALRQLKEVEGKLVLVAQSVRGDVELMRSILLTRLIPHFEGIVGVARRLENGMAALQRAQSNSSRNVRKQAFDVACALVEGRRLLETKGGD